VHECGSRQISEKRVHLGEGLSFMLPLLQHRLDEQREREKGAKAKRRPRCYFANNFHMGFE
jgi:hypothetical protein